ncbi:two pore domain potassium channel family protein [Candidatus Micrarchaeota archaeon]|nr:two pore domain potassium channel family protein [Candidatus Micrarchaeota archaeon]
MAGDPVNSSLINMLALLFLIYAVAVPFFMHFEGLRFLDAVYFTSMTITTVGYGDFIPQTDEGKIFVMFLAFAGISVIFYHIIHIGRFRERTIYPRINSHLALLGNLTKIYGESKTKTKKLKRKMK